MNSFQNSNLPPAILQAVDRLGFTQPTKIQTQARASLYDQMIDQIFAQTQNRTDRLARYLDSCDLTQGQAVSFLTPNDRLQWKEISRLLQKSGSTVPICEGGYLS